jgi:hypothetical protein
MIDARSDAHHPIKSGRAAVKYALNKKIVVMEYMGFLAGALVLGISAGHATGYVIGFYMIAAWAYNIPPVRLKDKAYADVLLESINYPIRLLIGWMCVLPSMLPPVSIMIIGWSFGAFAMSLKRLAEYQLFANHEQAVQYRKSYSAYGVHTLIICGFVYGVSTVFGLTIFMIKYKTELMLVMPLLIMWMGWYFLMGLQHKNCIIYPERLMRNIPFFAFSIVILIAAIILIGSNIPLLHILGKPLIVTQSLGQLKLL